MIFPSKEVVERVRLQYPVGSRVVLESMDDPYTSIPPGTEGTVIAVDDTATVHVDWSNGSSLGVVYGVDRIHRVE